MKKRVQAGERLLTDVELELMTVLWRLNEGTVADVIANLPPERKLAYTSVSTMLRILEQKQVVGSRKEGRGHVYLPRLAKAEYESKALKHVVKRVFDDTPVALVKQLLRSGDLKPEDLDAIRDLLAETEKRP